MVELAFSILASDFAHLADEVAAAERGGGTIVHVDVMDGHFVPNITFGPPMVKALRPVTKLPLDCHLMIENPDEFIPAFAEAGADMISVHQEACRHLHRTLQLIEHHGMQPGVVINPATPVEMLIEVLPMVHHVLVMSVNPGFGGQKFLPLALEKIAYLAELRHRDGAEFPDRSGWRALLTIRWLRWSKQERRCWWPARRFCSGPAGPRRMQQSFWRLAREAEACRNGAEGRRGNFGPERLE